MMKRNVLMDGNDSGTVMIEGLGLYVPMSHVRSLRAEVERLRTANLDSVAVCEQALQARAAAEQERDQLKAVLQRFMEIDVDDRDLRDELWIVQQEESPNNISLAAHDAEVIDRETKRCIDAVEAEPEYPDEAPPELMKYINQCIENKDADHMLHMMRHSVRLTKSEIINRIRGLETQQPSNDSCELEFNPDGEWCPERHTCERYLAWADRYKNTLTPDYRGISCSMAVRDCEHKIEVVTDE